MIPEACVASPKANKRTPITWVPPPRVNAPPRDAQAPEQPQPQSGKPPAKRSASTQPAPDDAAPKRRATARSRQRSAGWIQRNPPAALEGFPVDFNPPPIPQAALFPAEQPLPSLAFPFQPFPALMQPFPLLAQPPLAPLDLQLPPATARWNSYIRRAETSHAQAKSATSQALSGICPPGSYIRDVLSQAECDQLQAALNVPMADIKADGLKREFFALADIASLARNETMDKLLQGYYLVNQVLGLTKSLDDLLNALSNSAGRQRKVYLCLLLPGAYHPLVESAAQPAPPPPAVPHPQPAPLELHEPGSPAAAPPVALAAAPPATGISYYHHMMRYRSERNSAKSELADLKEEFAAVQSQRQAAVDSLRVADADRAALRAENARLRQDMDNRARQQFDVHPYPYPPDSRPRSTRHSQFSETPDSLSLPPHIRQPSSQHRRTMSTLPPPPHTRHPSPPHPRPAASTYPIEHRGSSSYQKKY